MEIEQMRIRMGEMAAEIERLQSVIDEANAQEPAIVVRGRKVVGFNPAEGTRIEGEFYARPIPAQQSSYQSLQLLAESRENFEKQFGFSSEADWVYKDLAELFISDLPGQQSPAVAVPDGWKLVPTELTQAMLFAANGVSIIGGNVDGDTIFTRLNAEEAKKLFVAFLESSPDCPTSPRITDHDDNLAFLVVKALHNEGAAHESVLESARRIVKVVADSLPNRITEQESFEIILSFYWFMAGFKNKNGRSPSVVEWYEAEGRSLLEKLNGAKNEKAD